MKAFYTRVSTKDQNDERQKIKAINCDKIYSDKDSGTILFADRKEAKKLMNDIRKGLINYVIVDDIDRLGRVAIDIQNTIDFFKQNKVQLFVIKTGMFMLEQNENGEIKLNENGEVVDVVFFKAITDLMANIAQMEREKMLERQREGIAIAKAQGKYKNVGRKLGTTETNAAFLKKHKNVVEAINLGLSVRKSAKLCEVSTTTVQKVKKLIKSTPHQTTLEEQIKRAEK